MLFEIIVPSEKINRILKKSKSKQPEWSLTRQNSLNSLVLRGNRLGNPSAVRDWNNIPDEHRNIDSVIAFKNVLGGDKPVVPTITFLEVGKNKSSTHA